MDGFLGTRADLVVDLVMSVSGFIPAVMLYSFYKASKGEYDTHKNIQNILLIALIISVVALELDIRFGELDRSTEYNDLLGVVFPMHLIFAISTPLLWFWLLSKSCKIYPKPFGKFNHKKWGWILFWDMTLSVISGWIVYLMAFAN